MDYSVVIPVYCEAESVEELCNRIFKVFEAMGGKNCFEIIFVDDGSTDSSRIVLRRLRNERPYVRTVIFRKNVGKTIALLAGFLNSKGDLVITIDGDLQDNPEDIPMMVKKIGEGYDLVSGWKHRRKDNLIRVIGSKIFNWTVSLLGGLKLHDVNCGFKIYKAKVIKNISIYGQYHRFAPLLAHFMGFKVAEVKVSHNKRKHGSSKYPVIRYEGFFDLLSILFAYRYKFSPLYFFGMLGCVFMTISMVIILLIAYGHALFVLGLGEDCIAKTRLVLPMAIAGLLSGINIFLIGFVCDFILHHTAKSEVIDLIESIVEEQ
jgi:glycosyltransferase involved in cell wall biosynthesis